MINKILIIYLIKLEKHKIITIFKLFKSKKRLYLNLFVNFKNGNGK